MIIYIGADHRGFKLKEYIKSWLSENSHEIKDLGAFDYSANDDYVDFATAVGEAISQDSNSKGIIICGSGAGVSIVANKFPNVRCGLGFSNNQVKAAREDDDINILSLASDFTNEDEAKQLISVFLETNFNPTENHTRRIEKIKALE